MIKLINIQLVAGRVGFLFAANLTEVSFEKQKNIKTKNSGRSFVSDCKVSFVESQLLTSCKWL